MAPSARARATAPVFADGILEAEMFDHRTIGGVASMVAILVIVLYLKVWRPLRGDWHSRREMERIDAARRRRIVRHLLRRPAG